MAAGEHSFDLEMLTWTRGVALDSSDLVMGSVGRRYAISL